MGRVPRVLHNNTGIRCGSKSCIEDAKVENTMSNGTFSVFNSIIIVVFSFVIHVHRLSKIEIMTYNQYLQNDGP